MSGFPASFANLLLWYAPAAAMLMASRLVVLYDQLSSYQFRGFLMALRRQWKHCFIPPCVLAAASALVCLLFGRLALAGKAMAVIAPLLGAALIVLAGYLTDVFVYRRREGKSSLKMTGRVKRLYGITALVMFLAFFFLRRSLPLMGVNALLILPLPVWILLGALLVWPVERVIYELYFRDARKVLRARNDLTVIAVTGSYGKTTVKFYLQTLLSQKYNVLCTRQSRNTPMGVSTSIRGDLTPAHNVFIAEMGARHRGDIRELCRLVNPTIGILTSVGPQHLETFGSIENVKQTKYDLIRSLPKNGFAVFGEDHGIVRGLYEQTGVEKAIVGAEGDDLWADDVGMDDTGTTFTLCGKDGMRLPCHAPVYGAHVVRNILLAAAVALKLGLTGKQIQNGTELIAPVQHRFKVETGPDGVRRINNGFNSNPVSSRQTLAELGGGRYEGRKIIITPGFVELGKEEKHYNRELGQNIAGVADLALLVGKNRTQPILEGLKEAGFSESGIHVFGTLKEANDFYETIKQEGDLVLYENDLPDHYSEV